MDLARFLERREALARTAREWRSPCVRCLQPEFSCYCAELRPFHPGIRFVILIHPIEARRRIATGRMTALSLEDSSLIVGHDYSRNARLNAILADPGDTHVLYPGRGSVNLSALEARERAERFRPADGRRLTLIVIDGTWHTARQMMNVSANLRELPRVCFTLDRPSRFRVRKQPAAQCFSTIEAVHEAIELLGPAAGFNPSSRKHDGLMHVFDWLVEKQLRYVPQNHQYPRMTSRALAKRLAAGGKQ